MATTLSTNVAWRAVAAPARSSASAEYPKGFEATIADDEAEVGDFRAVGLPTEAALAPPAAIAALTNASAAAASAPMRRSHRSQRGTIEVRKAKANLSRWRCSCSTVRAAAAAAAAFC